MIVPAQQFRSFQANSPITESGALRATSHNADVLGHASFL